MPALDLGMRNTAIPSRGHEPDAGSLARAQLSHRTCTKLSLHVQSPVVPTACTGTLATTPTMMAKP
eukprot:2049793-Alexandrium_andersonii.AAC.1